VVLGALVRTIIGALDRYNGVNLALIINLFKMCGKKPQLLKNPTRLRHSLVIITERHVFKLLLCPLILLFLQGCPEHPSIHLFGHHLHQHL
jgi:hypothetical protein